MIFKPVKLGRDGLTEQELQTDRKKSRNFGPCGVGEKALYLNSFYMTGDIIFLLRPLPAFLSGWR